MEIDKEDREQGQEQFDSSDPGDVPTYGPSPPIHPGKPILPGPIAKTVSFGTGTVRGALRAAKFVGGYPFSAAKFTALTSIELGRHTFESILGLAGRDVYARSTTDLGRAETYSAMARAFDVAHRGFTYLQLFTASGFDATGAGLATIADSFEFALTLLDGFLGSTESSRVLRSIGAFLIREFQNPATGMAGEKVGVVDLLCAFCSLVYLQVNCRVLDEQENQRLGIEEIVWDVIVVNGERADVHNESLYGMHKGLYNQATGEAEVARVMSQEPLEVRLRRQITGAIPDDAKVSISTSTSTTITVDITGSQPPRLDPPPGVELVEVGRVSHSSQTGDYYVPSEESDTDSNPTYRIVFRINRDEVRGSVQGSGPFPQGDTSSGFVEQLDDGVDDETTLNADDITLGASDDHPPPVPPKSSPTAPKSKSSSHPTSLPRPTTPRSPTANSFPSQIPSKANQKKVRLPASPSLSKPLEKPQELPPVSDKGGSSKTTRIQSPPPSKLPEKKGGFRSAFKKGTVPSLSSLLRGDEAGSAQSLPTKAKQPNQQLSQAIASSKVPQKRALESSLPIPGRMSSLIPKREAPRPPQRVRTPLTARALDTYDLPADKAQNAARRSDGGNDRDSLISVTDSLSIQTLRSGQNTRPVTPTMAWGDLRNPALTISRSERDLADYHLAPSPKMRRRSHVTTPSIYTLKTSDSQTSLMISPRRQRSAYNDADALDSLRRTGMVDGMFPRVPLLQSICKYIRFSSASYGHGFLKAMGIAKYIPPRVDEIHQEIHSFAYHTGLDTKDILLTSFIDAQGGPDSTGSTNTGVPLVHYIALDHEAKAVVLACRGTLGFEDVLADMACEYDDLFWRGKTYKVHKGIHASARRLLYGGDGRVLATLKDALDRHPAYGLVLCGHSLGGAVTALLGVMLSEPSGHSHSFITSTSPHVRLLSDTTTPASAQVTLPPSRPIHVFAYGPPGTMSSSLRAKTRGLITSVVQGNDLVPYLSLGVLHDFQAVALAFKTDNSSASAEFWQRLWQAFQGAMAQTWYNNVPRSGGGGGGGAGAAQDDEWAFAALKTLRASMLSRKLLPPGEVLTVETAGVLQRDAFVKGAGVTSVTPARRVVLNYVRDVETRFREIRFGLAVLTDHSPGRYEDALNMLRQGVGV